jgi:CRISPR-associated exonuclease Cas4
MAEQKDMDIINVSALNQYAYCPRRCGLIYEEMSGRPVPHGAIFHAASRRRREVVVTSELRRQVEHMVTAIRQMLASGLLPPPANDARCRECSLKDICQPEALADKGRQAAVRAALFRVEE